MLWYIGFNIQGCVAQPRTRFKRLLHMACYMRLYKFFFHSTISIKNALFQNKALGERTMFDFNFMITLVAENHCFSVWRIITVFQPSFRAACGLSENGLLRKSVYLVCAASGVRLPRPAV